MVSRRSTSSSTSTSSKDSISTPPTSARTESWEADEEDAMSSDDYAPSKSKSVAIPMSSAIQGPYCPRRPYLREILANTSPPPWTLAAFMAYLSNNHCLETLEFTMDAGRYRKHYQKMMSRASAGGTPPSKDREYVQALWQRLVDAYIRPNGSREVNIPAKVRDPILHVSSGALPPAPETLDGAVAKIYELMEDSVLVPFLNSAYTHTPHPSCPYDSSEDLSSSARAVGASRSHHSPQMLSSSPPRTAVEPHAHSYSAGSGVNRKSAPSNLSTSLNRGRFSVKLSPTTSSPAAFASSSGAMESMIHNQHHHAYSGPAWASGSGGAAPGITEDSGSAESPTHDSPMTPPMSPPISDASPRRDAGVWKKLGRLSGMQRTGKRKSHGALKEEQ